MQSELYHTYHPALCRTLDPEVDASLQKQGEQRSGKVSCGRGQTP